MPGLLITNPKVKFAEICDRRDILVINRKLDKCRLYKNVYLIIFLFEDRENKTVSTKMTKGKKVSSLNSPGKECGKLEVKFDIAARILICLIFWYPILN